MQKKTSSTLVKTIIAAKKNKAWIKIAEVLSGPRKNRVNLNLKEINKEIDALPPSRSVGSRSGGKGTSEEKIVVIPGKVLSQGEISKKIKIVALNFSEKAKEKLLKSKCEISSIIKEIKKNPRGKEIKILENDKNN